MFTQRFNQTQDQKPLNVPTLWISLLSYVNHKMVGAKDSLCLQEASFSYLGVRCIINVYNMPFKYIKTFLAMFFSSLNFSFIP
jgi:hypothetical protein